MCSPALGISLRAGRAAGSGGSGGSGGKVAQAFRPREARGALSPSKGRPASQQAPITSRPSQDPQPEDGARAVALLDRAIAAKGGLEKLRALKTIVAKQTQSSQRPEGETMIETTNYIQYPDRFRIEAPELIQGYDGSRSWM